MIFAGWRSSADAPCGRSSKISLLDESMSAIVQVKITIWVRDGQLKHQLVNTKAMINVPKGIPK